MKVDSRIMVRAMANTLMDNDVNPLDDVALTTTLIRSGFRAKDIGAYWDDVRTMTLLRRINDRRAAQRRIS